MSTLSRLGVSWILVGGTIALRVMPRVASGDGRDVGSDR